MSVAVVVNHGAQGGVVRLLDIGIASAPPLRQVSPLFTSYSDQRTLIRNHLCGYGNKGLIVGLPPRVPFPLATLRAAPP
eukprot:5341747-Pyramimonas_sp.AAC.1